MRLSPLPPGAPDSLNDLRNGVQELDQPTYPHRVFKCLEAELPDASNFTYCQAWVSDVPALVVSNGTDWINVATGVAV